MSEREPRHSEEPEAFRDFAARLPEPEHRRLLIGMGAGLQEARNAPENATQIDDPHLQPAAV